MINKHFLLNASNKIVKLTLNLIPHSSNVGAETASKDLLIWTVKNKITKKERELIRLFQLNSHDNPGYDENTRQVDGWSINQMSNYLFYCAPSRGIHNARKRIGAKRIVENNAKNALKARIGNCYELADVALVLFMELDLPVGHNPVSVEKAILSGHKNPSITGYDHSFLIMNRAPYSKLEDMKTWGKNAVICDPWSDKTFDVSRLLNIPKGRRPHMFNLIESGLRAATQVYIEHCFYIGSGHSDHWNQKYPNWLISNEPPFDHSCSCNMQYG